MTLNHLYFKRRNEDRVSELIDKNDSNMIFNSSLLFVSSLLLNFILFSFRLSQKIRKVIEKFSAFFLRDDALKSLYKKRLRKLRFEKVEINFIKLLQKFAVKLTTETKIILKRNIAQFIKKRVKRVMNYVEKHFNASLDKNK